MYPMFLVYLKESGYIMVRTKSQLGVKRTKAKKTVREHPCCPDGEYGESVITSYHGLQWHKNINKLEEIAHL